MISAQWVDAWTVGSCNFCHRAHKKVWTVKGDSSLVVRFCAKCMKELPGTSPVDTFAVEYAT